MTTRLLLWLYAFLALLLGPSQLVAYLLWRQGPMMLISGLLATACWPVWYSFIERSLITEDTG